MNRYLIPRRITQRWEMFAGIGWRELAVLGIGLLAGALLFGLASLVGLPLAIRAILVILPPGVAFMAARPLPTSESLLDMLLAWHDFSKRRHLYLYDFGRDDA